MEDGRSPAGIFDCRSPQIHRVSDKSMTCAAAVNYILFSIDPLLPSPLRGFQTTPIQTFIHEFIIKTLDMNLLPWRSRGDVYGFDIKIY